MGGHVRYATVVLTWGEAELHPLDEAFAADPVVEIESIHYINPVGEREYVELGQISGDLERARTILADSPAVLTFDVTEAEPGVGTTFLHYRASDRLDRLLAVLDEHEVVLDWPIEYADVDGERGIRVTMLGDDAVLGQALSNFPSGVDLSLERLGEYESSFPTLSSVLTPRQLEVFELAVERGYYELPRRTTHRTLAGELDLSPGTVSEHLQRIEVNLVGSVLSSMT